MEISHSERNCLREVDGIAQAPNSYTTSTDRSHEMGEAEIDLCGQPQLEESMKKGHFYENGEGPEGENLKEALYQYMFAAKHGLPEAYISVGRVCEKMGKMIGMDDYGGKALKYYSKAVEHGNQEALVHLAHLFEKNPTQWFTKFCNNWVQLKEIYQSAAAQGNGKAHFRLARLYHQHQHDLIGFNGSVKARMRLALCHYQAASRLGDPNA